VNTWVAPEIDWAALAPMIIVFGAGVVGVLVEAFVSRPARVLVQQLLSGLALAVALGAVVGLAGEQSLTVGGAVSIDGPTLFIQGCVLVFALMSLAMYADAKVDSAGDPFTPGPAEMPGSPAERLLTVRRVRQTEAYPLTLFAVSGMLLFPAANDLLTLFVALEVLSLPLYLLSGIARRRRLLSQEAALKYFLLGAYASAFLLFGSALVYGYAGSVTFADIDAAISARVGADALVLAGVGLIAVGLLFKVAAVPFHFWTPDVYQGAPTPVTAFMAAGTKIAAFGALLRLFYVAFGGLRADYTPMLWAVAIATMVLGSVLALSQTDIKRMLAYSAIAHAGFALVGMVGLSDEGLASVLFYLFVYGVSTIGAFAVVSLLRGPAGEATSLGSWAGLGRRSPLVAATMAVLLLSFAGIPLTAGFVAKLSVFTAAFDAGAAVLVVIAVLASAIAASFYVRVIVLMFFSDPPEEAPEIVVPSVLTTLTIVVSVGFTVALGVFPEPFLDLAEQAAEFVR
jgi:NADH-quinone oxidoreductase subunit N